MADLFNLVFSHLKLVHIIIVYTSVQTHLHKCKLYVAPFSLKAQAHLLQNVFCLTGRKDQNDTQPPRTPQVHQVLDMHTSSPTTLGLLNLCWFCLVKNDLYACMCLYMCASTGHVVAQRCTHVCQCLFFCNLIPSSFTSSVSDVRFVFFLCTFSVLYTVFVSPWDGLDVFGIQCIIMQTSLFPNLSPQHFCPGQSFQLHSFPVKHSNIYFSSFALGVVSTVSTGSCTGPWDQISLDCLALHYRLLMQASVLGAHTLQLSKTTAFCT